MTTVLSNADSLLVAIPMIGILFAGYFRLDEIFGKPKKKAEKRPKLSGMDRSGRPVCVDPDGSIQDPSFKRKY